MNHNILITGSSGFIGRYLKERLIGMGYTIKEFNSSHGDIVNSKIEWADVNCVFHLAGKSFVPDSWNDPAEFFRVNVLGTLNVLEYCRKHSCRMIFLSSYIYGIPLRLPVSEDHPANPSSPYALSKLTAENLCRFYADYHNLEVTIVRPFNIYGKGLAEHFLISEIISQVKNSSADLVLKDISPRRDYLFITDFIDALVLLFEKCKLGIFNMGYGNSLSVKQIADIIMNVSGVKKKIISLEKKRKNEIPEVVADISKLTSATGWNPKISFEEGIRQMLA